METALPELLPRTALHLNENSNNHLNANSSTASTTTTTTKPATSLNADQLHKLSTLRQANDQIILDHTQVITVAEGLTRELQSTTPFQGVDMVILERVEEMVEEAEQNLEAARNQVHDLVTKVEQSDVRNSSAYDTYKRNRDEALPLIAEAQEKRHCVEKGVSTLTESMIATLGDNGADDAMWLEAALQSTEGCKQLLDRQMALMQEIKKEKNTVVEQAERLQDEIEPLKSAVQELRSVSTHGGGAGKGKGKEGGGNSELKVMSELSETCAWYENVNRLICAVSGTSVIDRPDAFGDHFLRIQVHSALVTPGQPAASATLEVQFEPKTTNVVSAKVGRRGVSVV